MNEVWPVLGIQGKDLMCCHDQFPDRITGTLN